MELTIDVAELIDIVFRFKIGLLLPPVSDEMLDLGLNEGAGETLSLFTSFLSFGPGEMLEGFVSFLPHVFSFSCFAF